MAQAMIAFRLTALETAVPDPTTQLTPRLPVEHTLAIAEKFDAQLAITLAGKRELLRTELLQDRSKISQ